MAKKKKVAGHDDLNPFGSVASLSGHFTWVIILCLCFYLALIQCYKRRRKAPPTDQDKAADGYMVMYEWRPMVRRVVSAIIWVFLVVPMLIFMLSSAFGGILALIEGWSWHEAFAYVLGNAVGLGPIVKLVPVDPMGKAMDALASLLCLMLTATVLGLVSIINLSTTFANHVPPGFCGLLRALLIYVPLVLIATACVTGVVLALIEDWKVGSGILYMVGSLCGIEDPLTSDRVESGLGHFIEAICFCIETTIGGSIIGIIATHESVLRFVHLCEGKIGNGDAEEDKDAKIALLEEQLNLQRKEIDRLNTTLALASTENDLQKKIWSGSEDRHTL